MSNIFISFTSNSGFFLPGRAAFWPSAAFARTSLPLKPGTLHPRSARAWRSCSTGTRLRSIQRCPWQEWALLAERPLGRSANGNDFFFFFTLRPSRFALFFQNAKRASAAAAPLAAWVKANVQYSHVLERIEPLEREQAGLRE